LIGLCICCRFLRVTTSQIAMRCIWIVKVLAIILLLPLLANLLTVLIAIANGSTNWTLLVVHTVLVLVMTLTAVIRCFFLREVRPFRQGEVPVSVAAGDRPVTATRPMKKDSVCVMAACEFGMLPAASLVFHQVALGRGGQNEGKMSWGAAVTHQIKVDAAAQQTCLCCLEDFTSDSKVALLLCGHVFHEECIARWFLSSQERAGSCPTCRRKSAWPMGPATVPTTLC